MIKASHTSHVKGHAHNRNSHLSDEFTYSPHHGAQNMQLMHLLSALRATATPEKGISQYKSARVDAVPHPSPPVTCTMCHTSRYGHCGQLETDTHPLCGLWRSCVGPPWGKMHISGGLQMHAYAASRLPSCAATTSGFGPVQGHNFATPQP